MKYCSFDLETSPARGYFWGDKLYEQDILEVEEDSFILCFAYQWHHAGGVQWVGQPQFPRYTRDKKSDKDVVKKLWEVFNEADVLIAHNGKQFDVRKANARFFVHGLPPPSPYQVIDTKQVSKKHFAFISNKLDEISRIMESKRKLAHTGKKLWFDCMKGDKASWKIMEKYNRHDVVLLKDTYDRFLPWIDNHPNWNLDGDRPDCCPKCGSAQIQQRGSGFTRTTEYQRYSCKKCGGWFRGGNIKQTKLR